MPKKSPDEIRDALRALPVLKGDFPSFEPDRAPAQPAELFLTWLQEAIEAEVLEPHAMTVSTVDGEGRPNSRVLILKGLDDGQWLFAVSRQSQKGEELTRLPSVALNFHWRELGRQVRIRGRVIESSPEASAADFQARPDGSRAQALIGNQSKILDDEGDLEAAIAESQALLKSDPDYVPDHWILYRLLPFEVEFWQADRSRRHTRLRYSLEGQRWLRRRLWP